jgi:hypothetical protein
MTSKERLEIAANFKEPDRVPIELHLSSIAREFPEARGIVAFIKNEADNFEPINVVDYGFFGLPAEYSEEIIENSNDYQRIRHSYQTAVGEFYAITRHMKNQKYNEDYYWERRYIHTLKDFERAAHPKRHKFAIDKSKFYDLEKKIGNRGMPLVWLPHPLGLLVRMSNMSEVYMWFLNEPALIHKFLENTLSGLIESAHEMGKDKIGPYYEVVAYEMFLEPWCGPQQFDEYLFHYDKKVYDVIHSYGGKVRAHCHDKVMNYLKKFADMGIDSTEPLEPPPYGDVASLKKAKKLVEGQILLSGNIQSATFIERSCADVRQEVIKAISEGAPGGGFTLRTAGGTAGTETQTREQMVEVLKKIEVYIETALEFGQYPIGF